MPEGDISEPKSAVDMQIEALHKEMNDLREAYENQLKEYATANKELWAELHKAPVQDAVQAPVEADSSGFDMDKAVSVFNAHYGIGKEE